MKKLLIPVFLLASCANTNTLKEDSALQPTVQALVNEIIRLDYYIAHDRCFISYAVCMVDKKKDCWSTHEECVISAYEQYKLLLK